jgi:Ca2+-transporting ATPase
VFECKSEKRSIFQINPLDNPALILAAATSLAVTVAAAYLPWAQRILSTAPLTAAEFMRAILYAVSIPAISALAMLIPKRKPKGQEVEVVEIPG